MQPRPAKGPPNRKHPAKFSDPVLDQLRVLVEDEAKFLERTPNLLDPFAGVGKIHQLADIADTLGIELEDEWAANHDRTLVGDATDMPADWTSFFDIVATSVCYGNRYADHHNARDGSERHSYAHDLGRMPTTGSAAVMHWGEEYRDFHKIAYVEIGRVLRRREGDRFDCNRGGLFLLNVSNHYRVHNLQPVMEWHVRHLLDGGWWLLGAFPVRTQRSTKGANRDRAGFEMVAAFRPPADERLVL